MIGDINGAPCPKCGCCHTMVVDQVVAFGNRIDRLVCRHCSHRFAPDISKALGAAEDIPYRPSCLCPVCSAANPAVKSTQKKGTETIRYHRCECGHRFRTVEKTTA